MIDQRVRTLLRDNRRVRLHVLMVLWASPVPLSAKEISDELDCDPDSVENALPRMLGEGYVSKWPDGRHPKWWLGDKAGQLSLPGLQMISEGGKTPLRFPGEGGKTPLIPPSEGGKTPLRLIDLDRSIDLSGSIGEGEAAEVPLLGKDLEAVRCAAAVAWCGRHAVVGERRQAILANPFCTADRLDAWLTHWTEQGCTAKGEPFRSKWGALNYAIRCCLNGDEPPSMAAAQDAAAAPADETLPDDGADVGGSAAGRGADVGGRVDPLPELWSAICDRVIARAPELFTECLAHVRVVSLAAGVLVISMPVRFYHTFLSNEKKLLAMVADVLDDELVRVDLEVWGPR